MIVKILVGRTKYENEVGGMTLLILSTEILMNTI